MFKLFFVLFISSFVPFSVVDAAESGSVNFQQNQTEVRLQVNKVSLSEVLKQISASSGLLIHYSVLPDRIVSATFIGESIKAVLDCLLGGAMDMVFRYHEITTDFPNKYASEVWLLGSSLGQDNYSGQCSEFDEKLNQPLQKGRPAQVGLTETSRVKKRAFRMQMAVSDNALHRAQAISYLAVNTAVDDKGFNLLVDDALTDTAPEVRVQAISALVRRQGEQNSITELQQALQDVDASVRISALQQLKEATDLIELALNDENKAVRQLARMKLQTK